MTNTVQHVTMCSTILLKPLVQTRRSQLASIASLSPVSIRDGCFLLRSLFSIPWPTKVDILLVLLYAHARSKGFGLCGLCVCMDKKWTALTTNELDSGCEKEMESS